MHLVCIDFVVNIIQQYINSIVAINMCSKIKVVQYSITNSATIQELLINTVVLTLKTN